MLRTSNLKIILDEGGFQKYEKIDWNSLWEHLTALKMEQIQDIHIYNNMKVDKFCAFGMVSKLYQYALTIFSRITDIGNQKLLFLAIIPSRINFVRLYPYLRVVLRQNPLDIYNKPPEFTTIYLRYILVLPLNCTVSTCIDSLINC